MTYYPIIHSNGISLNDVIGNTTSTELASRYNIVCTLTVYILELSGGKYYVGKSNSVTDQRIKRQLSCSKDSSKWVQIHKPTNRVTVFNNQCDFDEDRITLIMMKLYGIDNVRGGSFSSCSMNAVTKSMIQETCIMPQLSFTEYVCMNKSVFVYTLKNCKYLVLDRFIDCEWIHNHPIIKDDCVITNCNYSHVNMCVIIAMYKYGISNVRGENFLNMQLQSLDRDLLNTFIDTALNKCYECKSVGHFTKHCTFSGIVDRFRYDRLISITFGQVKAGKKKCLKKTKQVLPSKTITLDKYFIRR